MNGLSDITVRGRDVVVRRRYWCGPFHCEMFEVRAVVAEEPYPMLAVFYGVDEVWKYITAEGHRVRNWKSWLLTTIDVYRQCREMDKYVASLSESGENYKSDGV